VILKHNNAAQDTRIAGETQKTSEMIEKSNSINIWWSFFAFQTMFSG
jgi:hypothetical protein